MDEHQERRRKVARVIANAWLDPAYHDRLKRDPHGVLTEAGVKVPKHVKVVEDTDDVTHLVIPKKPAGLEEHRRKYKENPNICSEHGGIICSDHPDICTIPPSGTTRPDLCSIG